MSFEINSVVPTSHPSLAGHFPDNPIVPGVVVLDEVIGALQSWQPQAQSAGFTAVKFMSPLLPDQNFVIYLTDLGKRRVKFSCQKTADGDNIIFATGQVKLVEPVPESSAESK